MPRSPSSSELFEKNGDSLSIHFQHRPFLFRTSSTATVIRQVQPEADKPFEKERGFPTSLEDSILPSSHTICHQFYSDWSFCQSTPTPSLLLRFWNALVHSVSINLVVKFSFLFVVSNNSMVTLLIVASCLNSFVSTYWTNHSDE